MKKLFIILNFVLSFEAFSQLAIGTNSPHSSAMLDLTSTTQGFLPPRMTGAQRDAIVSPVAGLEIWCLDCGSTAPYGEAQIFNGTIWTNLAGGTVKSVSVPGTNTSGGATSPIGIGTNTPSSSAALEVNSTTKGFLVPRMTSTERNRIEPPSSAAGLQVWCTDCNAGAGELSIFNGEQWTNSSGALASFAPPFGGSAICDGTRPTVIKEVTTSTGKTWMDRNLGASRVALTSGDYFSYGCFYQWGRGNDGHASMNFTSSTSGAPINASTSTLSTTDTPGNSLFITGTLNTVTYASNPGPDWRSGGNDNLWQGVNGTNNPCPSGFRLPTISEIQAELNTNRNLSLNTTGIQVSTVITNLLKFPASGDRRGDLGTFSNGNVIFRIWSSTIFNADSSGRSVGFEAQSSTSFQQRFNRVWGFPVRCIKN